MAKKAKKSVKKAKKIVKRPEKKETCKDNKCNKTAVYIIGAVIIAVLIIFISGGFKMDTVKEGSKIKLHYTGTLDDGTVFDTSKTKGEPLEFVIGQKQVIPGFEAGLMGLKVGDTKTIKVSSEDAYGARDDTRVAEYPKEKIPGDMQKLEEGVQVLFQDDQGNVLIATVKEIKEKDVVLDLNHPLAGKNLTFEVEILEIDNSGAK
jgi:peptidylprolyl isomerase